MKKVTGLGGIFLKCEDPKKQASWYEKHLGLSLEDWGGSVFRWRDLNDKNRKCSTVWGPFTKESTYFDPSPKPFMINYRVADLEQLLAQLKEEGVEQIGETDHQPYAKFAWIMDPEGNKIELWEPVDERLEE